MLNGESSPSSRDRRDLSTTHITHDDGYALARAAKDSDTWLIAAIAPSPGGAGGQDREAVAFTEWKCTCLTGFAAFRRLDVPVTWPRHDPVSHAQPLFENTSETRRRWDHDLPRSLPFDAAAVWAPWTPWSWRGRRLIRPRALNLRSLSTEEGDADDRRSSTTPPRPLSTIDSARLAHLRAVTERCSQALLHAKKTWTVNLSKEPRRE
jgi:hypothetical protein